MILSSLHLIKEDLNCHGVIGKASDFSLLSTRYRMEWDKGVN